MSRPRRAAATSSPSVTVARPPALSSDDSKKSIRLTVKMPSSKLRQATSGQRKSIAVNSRDVFEPGEIMSGPRGSRAKRPIVEESASEDEDEEDDEGYDEEDEGPEEEQEEEEEDDIDNDAEGESEDQDAEGDIDMDDAPPPPPVLKIITAPASKSMLTVTPAPEGKLKNVEAKEMNVEEDDDEELSSLDSQDQGGEEAEEGAEEAGSDEEDQEADSDEGTPALGSRASTPDLSKLTRRQRTRLDEVMSGELLELPSESKVKKHLTAEEHAMRRAEMARRRKNLSEKRNEEEKMDTINKLLKKQAPKRRGRAAPGELAGDATPNTFEPELERPKATFIRWVSNREGNRIGVPEEWLGTPVGKLFGPPRANGSMVAEIEG
ncbi:MAG: hypothetical protein M1835_005168 [Candelina submexicana]|nr:MAG: hypothetical protein M1835_005168 [Candelina submexicana]